jgi:hypothetical protein
MKILKAGLLPVIISTFLLPACYQSRKAQVEARIAAVESRQAAEDSLIKAVQEKRQARLAAGEIDDTIAIRLQQKLLPMQRRSDSLHALAAELRKPLESRKTLRKAYKNDLLSRTATLEVYSSDSLAERSRAEALSFIADVLAEVRRNQFGLAAFFGSGEFIILPENMPLISQSFVPLIDSLIAFSNRHANIPREAYLAVYGYADGQPVNTEGALADTLLQTMGRSAASSAELNTELSRLRAMEMHKAIDSLRRSKEALFLKPELLTYVDVVKGMGEAYPNPTIKDYAADDERRRIVLFYWNVLPK